MFGNGTQYTLPEWINDLSIEDAVKLILLGMFGTTAPSGSGGGLPVVPTGQTVTAVPNNLAASASLVIPAGAKGWTVSCLTGTISIVRGTTASLLPAGFSDSDPNIVAAAITVTTASASTAYVRWNT